MHTHFIMHAHTLHHACTHTSSIIMHFVMHAHALRHACTHTTLHALTSTCMHTHFVMHSHALHHACTCTSSCMRTHFVMHAHTLHHTCTRRFASSSTVTELPGKNQGHEITVQVLGEEMTKGRLCGVWVGRMTKGRLWVGGRSSVWWCTAWHTWCGMVCLGSMFVCLGCMLCTQLHVWHVIVGVCQYHGYVCMSAAC